MSFCSGSHLGPVPDADGAPRYVLGSRSDATAEKQHEAALVDQARFLESQVKMRTRDLEDPLVRGTMPLHEVDRRVKNTPQMISAMLMSLAMSIQTPRSRIPRAKARARRCHGPRAREAPPIRERHRFRHRRLHGADYRGAIGLVEKPFTRLGLDTALAPVAARPRHTSDTPSKPRGPPLSPAHAASRHGGPPGALGVACSLLRAIHLARHPSYDTAGAARILND